jgi:hypothetical protein
MKSETRPSHMRNETKPGGMRDETDPATTTDDTEPGHVRDERRRRDLWNRTKTWAAKNRTISGALVGGAAGIIVPGVGPMIGALVGAGVGFASSKERNEELEHRRNGSETERGRRVSD